MNASIKYLLSEAGRKASLLSGGNGQREQVLTLDSTDPLFPRLLERAAVGSDGTVSLDLTGYSHLSHDAPQTVLQLLDSLDGAAQKKLAEEAAHKERVRVETLAILTGKKVRWQSNTVALDRTGTVVSYGVVSESYRYASPDWPYDASREVKDSPEAVAWIAELEAAKAAAIQVATEECQPKLAVLLEKERLAAEAAEAAKQARIARKLELGALASDTLLRIEDGALMTAPVYDNGSRSKNWLAVISVSPSSPGGLSREFATRARGDACYLMPPLSVGDPVEFGADSYSSRGRRTTDRWYGFVVAIASDCLILRKAETGKAACKAGQGFSPAVQV